MSCWTGENTNFNARKGQVVVHVVSFCIVEKRRKRLRESIRESGESIKNEYLYDGES